MAWRTRVVSADSDGSVGEDEVSDPPHTLTVVAATTVRTKMIIATRRSRRELLARSDPNGPSGGCQLSSHPTHHPENGSSSHSFSSSASYSSVAPSSTVVESGWVHSGSGPNGMGGPSDPENPLNIR
jgi:hypothetical protein